MWKRQLREVKELPQSNTTREWWGRNGPAFPKGAPVPWAPGIALGPLTYSQGKKQELGDPRPGWSLFGGSGEAIRLILLGCSLVFLPLGGQLLDISGEGLQAHTPSPTSESEQTVTQIPGRASNHAGSCGNMKPLIPEGAEHLRLLWAQQGNSWSWCHGFQRLPQEMLRAKRSP